MSFQPRFADGVYRDCRFCKGTGCIACPGEADKEYRRQFPDGPKSLATFNLEDAADREKMADLVGAQAIKKHFGEGGGDMGSFVDSLRAAGKLEQ